MFCDMDFFFNDTATTEIYTLSLHDALPICSFIGHLSHAKAMASASLMHHRSHPTTFDPSEDQYLGPYLPDCCSLRRQDRKSTRLNSSHANISYAVFCLKKIKYDNTTVHDEA